MKKFLSILLILVLFVACFAPSSVHAASLGYKWPDNVSIIYRKYPDGLFTTQEINAIRSAFNQWNNVPLSYSIPHYKNLFLSASVQTLDSTVSKVDAGWMYGLENIAYTDNYHTNGTIHQSRILLNDQLYDFSAGLVAGTYHIQSVVLHEAGHVLGIAHCHQSRANCNSSCLMNIMAPAALPTATMRTTFQSYDMNSYCNIYQ